ncbi:hypothetical protein I4U23_009986 [Adineta vaga]|nr:hypothetical protein I4U23_009986 [Adineta vaga]
MATTSTSQGEISRRRLPKLTSSNPVGGSSDDTPRTTTGEETARERRRARQQSAREQTPDDRETLPLPPRSNPSEDRQTTKRRKARRRVKSSSQLEQEPSLLRGFEDEVIIEKSKKSNELVLPDLLLSNTYAGNTLSKSAATPRIYFEDKNKFSSVNKDAATVRIGNRTAQSPFTIGYDDNHTFQQQTTEVLKRFTVQVAKQTHSALQKFFLFIHGINAGYALWVCVFAFVFTDDNPTSFFTIYRTIALITHLLFYIFLAICMVDVLDRIDPVKFNGTVLLQTITAQNSGPAFIFYTVAMVVNLVMMQTEDQLRMSFYVTSTVNTTNTYIANVVNNDTNTWRILTAVRAAFSILGWFIVSINVKNDRLSLMIKNTEEKAFYEELRIEQNTVPLAAGITSA